MCNQIEITNRSRFYFAWYLIISKKYILGDHPLSWNVNRPGFLSGIKWRIPLLQVRNFFMSHRERVKRARARSEINFYSRDSTNRIARIKISYMCKNIQSTDSTSLYPWRHFRFILSIYNSLEKKKNFLFSSCPMSQSLFPFFEKLWSSQYLFRIFSLNTRVIAFVQIWL